MTEKQKEMIKKKEECKRLWETTDLPGEEIAKKVGVSPTTFWRWKNNEGWERYSAKNANPMADNSEEDEISINFRSISLNQYNELLYAIQTDDALSMMAKGFALEFIPFLLTNLEDTLIPTIMPASDLTCWKELVDNGYIAEHQQNSNLSNERKTYEFTVSDTVANLKEKLLEKDKEIEKLNEILKRYKEISDLYD